MSEGADARRAVARRLHPDLGGDPQEYAAAMARLEDRFGQPRARPMDGSIEVHVMTRRRPLSALTHSAGRAATKLRSRIPRGWPGAHRYGQL